MPPAPYSKYAILLALWCGAASAGSQPAPPPSAPIQVGGQTATRLVQLYGELEKSLVQAVRTPASNRLQDLISNDFQCRTADGLMLDSKGWLSTLAAEQHVIQDMAVQSLDGLDVVSFSQIHTTTLKRRWVVDVWKAGAQPQLMLRHQSDWVNVRMPPMNRPPAPSARTPDGKG